MRRAKRLISRGKLTVAIGSEVASRQTPTPYRRSSCSIRLKKAEILGTDLVATSVAIGS